MSADLLRRAAAEMRDRVDAVPEQSRVHGQVVGVWLNSRHYLTTTPEATLAAADQLEAAAVLSAWRDLIGVGVVSDLVDRSVAVARAYLGEPA